MQFISRSRRSGAPRRFRFVFVFMLAAPVFQLVAAESETRNLMRAVRMNDAVTWRALLQAKADVNIRDAAGNTPLHFAALNHDLEAVNALLVAGAQVDVK